MKLEYSENGNAQEFWLSGKLDYDGHKEFDEFIQLHYQKGLDVMLNLEQLSHISSVGLRSFIGLAKLVRADKRQICVKAGEDSIVKKIITLSGFSKLMLFV